MNKITGGSLPARTWKSFMTEASRGVPATSIPGAVPPSALDRLVESLMGGGPAEGSAPSPTAPATSSPPRIERVFPDLNRGN